jgi:hypothetical protein
VLRSGSSVTYQPDAGYSGIDTFEYTITDDSGETAGQRRSPSSCSLPAAPINPRLLDLTEPTTRLGHKVTIDVLANDIDPERDVLTVTSFQPNPGATITDTRTIGPACAAVRSAGDGRHLQLHVPGRRPTRWPQSEGDRGGGVRIELAE